MELKYHQVKKKIYFTIKKSQLAKEIENCRPEIFNPGK